MRGRRRRGVVMFWGERGEDGKDWEEGMEIERREMRKMNKKGVIVGWVFFVVMNLGGVFWKEGLR